MFMKLYKNIKDYQGTECKEHNSCMYTLKVISISLKRVSSSLVHSPLSMTLKSKSSI